MFLPHDAFYFTSTPRQMLLDAGARPEGKYRGGQGPLLASGWPHMVLLYQSQKVIGDSWILAPNLLLYSFYKSVILR